MYYLYNVINEENQLYLNSNLKKPKISLRLLLSNCICFTPPFFQFPSNNSHPGLAYTLMKNDLKAHTERDTPSALSAHQLQQ